MVGDTSFWSGRKDKEEIRICCFCHMVNDKERVQCIKCGHVLSTSEVKNKKFKEVSKNGTN